MRTNPQKGYFGEFGGRFVPELLVPALDQLERAYRSVRKDPAFKSEFDYLLKTYAGRPTPLTLCRNLSVKGGARIYLKREDLLHGGAHKINQVLGQALLARHMGKRRVIAETGAGQHGVATAMVCALLGLEAVIYMGAKDCARQKPNLFRMRFLGAKVVPVRAGGATLKEAINEALRDWAESFETTHYLLGTAAGPHPYPEMVRTFHQAIGKEARAQFLAREGMLPEAVIACVGGGSNAIGIFSGFLEDREVKLIGVEAAGKGLSSDAHCASILKGRPGILHGARSYVLQDWEGQIATSHSVSAGLDYPAVGPEHAHLHASGRATYVGVTDREALRAFSLLAAKEGILPALESAHALAYALKLARKRGGPKTILVNLSGRGDKDLDTVRKHLGDKP